MRAASANRRPFVGVMAPTRTATRSDLCTCWPCRPPAQMHALLLLLPPLLLPLLHVLPLLHLPHLQQ